jgi:hypothetical protein
MHGLQGAPAICRSEVDKGGTDGNHTYTKNCRWRMSIKVNDPRESYVSTRKTAKNGGPDPKPKKDFNSKISTQDKEPPQGARSGGCLMCGGCQITGHCMLES